MLGNNPLQNNKFPFSELSSDHHNTKIYNTAKAKRICKQSQKYKQQSEVSQEVSGIYKKKENAKQAKRLREQNRRAVHKEYVSNLQVEIQKKEMEIKRLQIRIVQLEQQLQTKVCHKCGGEQTETQNISPVQLQKINSIQIDQIQIQDNILDSDDQFRRINDQSSLRICYGNKNLLFFFVTMCCLTIGSIADNPEIFFQPILPYRTKSQMCYLTYRQKLDHYLTFRNRKQHVQQQWDEFYKNKMNFKPLLDQDVSRVSDMFDITLLFRKLLPKNIPSLLTSLKDPYQMLLDLGTNQIFGRLIGAQNHYI